MLLRRTKPLDQHRYVCVWGEVCSRTGNVKYRSLLLWVIWCRWQRSPLISCTDGFLPQTTISTGTYHTLSKYLATYTLTFTTKRCLVRIYMCLGGTDACAFPIRLCRQRRIWWCTQQEPIRWLPSMMHRHQLRFSTTKKETSTTFLQWWLIDWLIIRLSLALK